VLIWLSLAALGATVVVVTFRGGPIPEGKGGAAGVAPAPVERGALPPGSRGEMAYDRWRPGNRSDPARLGEGSP
jgi:hypothetical protein